MLALCTAVTLRRPSRRAYSKAKRQMRSEAEPGDDLDGLGGVLAHHVLDARVEVLGVLAHDDQVDVLVARAHAGDGHGRPQVGVEVELLAQGHVHAAEAGAHRRGDGALDGHPRVADRVEDLLGQRACRTCSMTSAPASTSTHSIGDAGGRHRLLGRRHDLRSDAVAGDAGHSIRHNSSWVSWVTRASPGSRGAQSTLAITPRTCRAGPRAAGTRRSCAGRARAGGRERARARLPRSRPPDAG